ncbi:MAG: low temperature requirement protein A [Roseivivax sp.]|nr:low temperature requirement protein A [Roseivivax sp.]
MVSLWWLYFQPEDHLTTSDLPRALLWGYGQFFVFAGGALVAAGLGAWFDLLTHHSQIDSATAVLYLNLPVALFLVALFVIRDIWHSLGVRMAVLPLATVAVLAAGFAGYGPQVTAAILAAAVITRLSRGKGQA